MTGLRAALAVHWRPTWYLPELIRIQSRLRPFCRRNIIRQTKTGGKVSVDQKTHELKVTYKEMETGSRIPREVSKTLRTGKDGQCQLHCAHN
jgi:hypothetical protein